jgi:XapX domain-containing protein
MPAPKARSKEMAVKLYLIALGAGLLAGIVYGLLNVRSPAPPVVALVGLLGILVGEQVVPLAKRLAAGDGLSIGTIRAQSANHVLGKLPRCQSRPVDRSRRRQG